MHRLDLIGVEKKFGDKIAVQRTDLHLESGIYGLLGENGAGKTTLMRMICGIFCFTIFELHGGIKSNSGRLCKNSY